MPWRYSVPSSQPPKTMARRMPRTSNVPVNMSAYADKSLGVTQIRTTDGTSTPPRSTAAQTSGVRWVRSL